MKPPASPAPAAAAEWPARGRFTAPAALTLAAALRAALPGRSWNELRRLCSSGKVSVNGAVTSDPALRLAGGESVGWDLSAPDPRRACRSDLRVVYEDTHLVVVDKPEGIPSVPYDPKETGTTLDLVRAELRRRGRSARVALYVVHRLDKDTSGLLCFARTKVAERGLHRIFKQHLADRVYVAVAHGRVEPARFESRLVPNRGDGLRGSTRLPWGGRHAVTHVAVDERLPAATVCRVVLETGRTHQIRIHLAEAGHPLVGETVYTRDFLRTSGGQLASARLLLHATTLGFDHPVTPRRLEFASPLPADFTAALERLRCR